MNKIPPPMRARIRGVAVSIASHRIASRPWLRFNGSRTIGNDRGWCEIYHIHRVSTFFQNDAPRVSDKLHMSDCSYRNRTRFTSIDSSIGSIHPPSRARMRFFLHPTDDTRRATLDSTRLGRRPFQFQFSIFNFRGKIEFSRASPASSGGWGGRRVVRRPSSVVRRMGTRCDALRSVFGVHHPRARYLFCFPTHPTCRRASTRSSRRSPVDARATSGDQKSVAFGHSVRATKGWWTDPSAGLASSREKYPISSRKPRTREKIFSSDGIFAVVAVVDAVDAVDVLDGWL